MASRRSGKSESIEINVGALRQRLGQSLDIDINMAFDGLSVVQSRSSDQAVTGTLRLESIERGVVASGTIKYGWQGECRRCLKPISGSDEVDVYEIFQIGASGEDDLIDFDGEHVELAPIVRDSVHTALPLAPLCSDECLGPDPDRYPAVSEYEAEKMAAEAPPKPDPRWAALADLDLDD